MAQATVTDALRRVPLFAGLPEGQLAWIAERGAEVRLPAGARLATEGDPADGLYVVLEGETEWTKRVGRQEAHVVTLGPGTIFAELILLLDAPYPTSGRAVTAVRLLKLEPDAFWQLLASCRQVLRGIVAVAAERSELHASVSQQQAKLISLGTLAAGLAHELNNPAAAVRRGVEGLQGVFGEVSDRALALGERGLTPAQRAVLAGLPREVAAAPDLDPLARSDREDAVATWLDARGVADGWDLAPAIVEAGIDVARLEGIAGQAPAGALGEVLAWLVAEVTAAGLLDEIGQGVARISRLVGAVSEYSFLDQAPLQEVDVHEGLESTLVILDHKLRGRIALTREYDPDLPRIEAYGSELNQVWTGLLDNAIDALAGADGAGRIRIRTAREPGRVLVEIVDDGPGIPPAIQGRIWEPFFTTKNVGQGTGLGLDIARRIVAGQHRGDIRVESVPGDTRFQVRLPLSQSRPAGNG